MAAEKKFLPDASDNLFTVIDFSVYIRLHSIVYSPFCLVFDGLGMDALNAVVLLHYLSGNSHHQRIRRNHLVFEYQCPGSDDGASSDFRAGKYIYGTIQCKGTY